MTRLLLVRHGQTAWNHAGRLQGWCDQPLDETGRRQAQILAGRLSGEPFERILCSDLPRALETAQIINRARPQPLPISLEPGLREIHFGAWEGLTYAQVSARDPEAADAWQRSWAEFCPPGGESLPDLARRVTGVWQALQAAPPGARLLVVAHGGPLQALLCLALGLPFERGWQFRVEPGGLAELNLYPQGAILNRLNG